VIKKLESVLIVIAATLVVLTAATAYGGETADWLNEAKAGKHVLPTSLSVTGAMFIDVSGGDGDTTIVLDLVGVQNGFAYQVVYRAGDTGDVDTLWNYVWNDSGTAKVAVPWIGIPGTVGVAPFRIAEGDTFRINKNSAGVAWARAEGVGELNAEN
jgi:hypothetical protein